MTGNQGHYAIAISDSGSSKSSLGIILARHSLRVIIFNVGVHAKFTVGERFFASENLTLQKRLDFRHLRTTVTRDLRAAHG